MSQEIEVLKQESLPPVDVGSKYTLEPKDEMLRELGLFLDRRLKRLKDFRDRSDWERDKGNALSAYYMVPKPRVLPYAGAANLACPFPRIAVDAFHANSMSSLYVHGNRMEIVPVLVQKEFASTASRAAQYMTYVMNHEANSYLVVDDADKKSHLFGTGYLEPTYVKEEIWETVDIKETKRVPTPDPMTGEITFKEKSTTRREKKKKTVFDGTKIHSLPVESIYRNPLLLSLEECVRSDVVFKVFTLNWSDIQDRSKPQGDNPSFYRKGEVEKIQPYIREKVYRQLSALEQARADKDGFFVDFISREESVELVQAYFWYDVDGDGIKEELNVTFHPTSKAVLRVALSPCRIVDLVPRPVDGRGEGEGLPRMCSNLSEEWEVFHNTRANAGQWENMPFGFYRAGGQFNPQQITIQPGHFYPVADPREVSFPQTQRVGQSYFEEEKILWDIFERVVAVNENMQGAQSARRRTATESINVSNRASIRFSNPFNRTVTGINKLLEHIWELNRECAPEDKEFYVLGDGGAPLFEKMTRYDFSANMKFAVSVSSVFDQQMIRDSMLLAYRLFITNPIVQQHPGSFWELSQKTLDTLNIDVDLPKPPEAKPITAFEAIEMLKSGEPIEPEVGIDYDHHLKICMRQMNADDIKEWEPEAVMRLVMYIDKLKILKQALESANLNKSGVFPGMPGQGNGNGKDKQPPVTSNRNPTQRFNTMKVGESGKSMAQNVRNGQKGGGGNAEGNMDQIMGQPVS